MKRLLSSPDAGLMPIFKSTIINMQDQAQNGIYSIIAAFADASEGGIIVSGLDVASINTGASTIALNPGYVALNGNLISVPAGYSGSYPVYISEGTPIVVNETWKDGSTHQYTIERVVNFTTSDPGAVQKILFNPFSSQYLPLVVKRKSTIAGEIIPFGGALNKSGIALFDSTGLGLFDWKGFAFANGSNGTRDLRKRFIVGYDPTDSDYGTVGALGGEKAHALITSENAPHTHDFTVTDGNTIGNIPHGLADVTGIRTVQTVSSGSGTPHENRPPYYTLAYLQKI